MTHSALLIMAALTVAGTALAATAPSTDGLVLWLDASDRKSVEADADGRVSRWLDTCCSEGKFWTCWSFWCWGCFSTSRQR